MSDIIDQAQEIEQMYQAAALSNVVKYTGVSATHCRDCHDPIAEARREAVPGCIRCTECASIIRV